MRVARLIAVTTVLALSIVSTTFVLLAATSSEWSSQSYFSAPGGTLNPNKTNTPVCTAWRSPFYRCGIPQVDIDGNCNITDCAWYKPSGTNQTSCRSASEYGVEELDEIGAHGLLGGAQECQQGKPMS
jgi:hypothetical protein